MNYCIYLSRATQAMSQDDLTTLIEGCIDHNNQNDLTGLLMYKGPLSSEGDAYFMQLLEGPSEQLEQLKTKIKVDARHTDFVILEEGEVESRTFPKWSMGLRHVDDAKYAGQEGYADLASPDFWSRAQNGELENMLSVMQFFSDEDV